MPYTAYLLLHFFGIFLLFVTLGGLLGLELGGISAPAGSARLLRALHGVALLAVLVAGFGMMARMGIHGMPPWILVKVGVWLALGAAPVLIRRGRALAGVMAVALPLLGLVSAWAAVSKPGM